MRIVPPENFRHAAEIPARLANNDPRLTSFKENSIEIDLRARQFVRPPAVLWCVVYPLLTRSRSAECRFLVPENMGVSAYLKSLGVFQLLKEEGVEVDDRGVKTTLLIIHSGLGSVEISEDAQRRARRTSLFPGIGVRLNTDMRN